LVGLVEINFSCEDPSIDPLVSIHGGRDPLPTIASIGSNSFQFG